MPRSVPAVFFMMLAIALPATADEARDVVERAMKARADKPELLDKQRCEIIFMTGKMIAENDKKQQVERQATWEIQAKWPYSQRWERQWENPQGKGKVAVAMVYQRDKAWTRSGPFPPVNLDLITTEEFRLEIYGRWLATLYPLKDKAFTLTLAKDSRVNDDEVSVVKVAMRFQPDVYLSFSKKTGHLLKLSYSARENGTPRRKEHYFSEYKNFEGLNLPTKVLDMAQDGNSPSAKLGEWTVTSYKFVDSLDDSVFAKPEEKK